MSCSANSMGRSALTTWRSSGNLKRTRRGLPGFWKLFGHFFPTLPLEALFFNTQNALHRSFFGLGLSGGKAEVTGEYTSNRSPTKALFGPANRYVALRGRGRQAQ